MGTHLLVAFAQTLRRGDLVRLCAGAGEVGVRRVQQGEEAVEQQIVLDRPGLLVLPDTGAADGITSLDGLLLLLLLLVTAGLRQLGIEVLLGGLLGLLLLLPERAEVALAVGSGLLAVLALGRLLLLLLGQAGEHVSDLVDGGVGAVALGGLLGSVHFGGFGDVALGIDNSGAFAECNRLAGLAFFDLEKMLVGRRRTVYDSYSEGRRWLVRVIGGACSVCR